MNGFGTGMDLNSMLSIANSSVEDSDEGTPAILNAQTTNNTPTPNTNINVDPNVEAVSNNTVDVNINDRGQVGVENSQIQKTETIKPENPNVTVKQEQTNTAPQQVVVEKQKPVNVQSKQEKPVTQTKPVSNVNNNISLETITKIFTIAGMVENLGQIEQIQTIISGKTKKYSLPEFVYDILTINPEHKQTLIGLEKSLKLSSIERAFYFMELDKKTVRNIDKLITVLVSTHKLSDSNSPIITVAKNITLSVDNLEENVSNILSDTVNVLFSIENI